tara:strand:+ start:103 stop:1278 length:1176 start_codon:yes stop_codon:yes gene_type:complete
MVSKTLEKARVKGRKNRVTIDDQYMGPEPWWDKNTPPPTDASARSEAWTRGAQWYNYYSKPKDYTGTTLKYAKEVLNFDKEQINALKTLSDWELNYGVGAITKLYFRGWNHEDIYLERVSEHLNAMVIAGKEVAIEKKVVAADAPAFISPAKRSYNNMMETIHADWSDIVIDSWMVGDFKPEFNVYDLWKKHGLKSNVINAFKAKIQFEYDLVFDAYNKTCEQAVEAYSHISPRRQKKMLNLMDGIFADLEKLKTSFKAVKIPRAKKPKSTDLQVAKLQYLQEHIESKVTSINPVLIPTKEMLWVYNTKQKALTQYVTTSTTGFEIRGSTIKNFDDTLSKTSRLRKPQDVLPEILKLTPKQIDKRVWDKLTTKISVPNGRINKDCVLLRVI